MNHPNREDLVAFLYEELTPEARAELATHVAECAECRAQWESWRAVRRELGTWKLPEPNRQEPRTSPVGLVKWAAAAAILVGVGFGVARLTTAPAAATDAAALRAAVAQELRQELRAELTKFSADQTARQQKYQAELTTALGRMEAQRLVDYARLRQDVETVAVRAEGELETTRQNLVRLASQGQ